MSSPAVPEPPAAASAPEPEFVPYEPPPTEPMQIPVELAPAAPEEEPQPAAAPAEADAAPVAGEETPAPAPAVPAIEEPWPAEPLVEQPVPSQEEAVEPVAASEPAAETSFADAEEPRSRRPPRPEPALTGRPKGRAEGRRVGPVPPPITPGRTRRRSGRENARPAPIGPPRERRQISRLAALVALGAVLIAVVVAVVSLSSKSSSKPVPLPAVVNVLIPEGKTRLQIAEIAKAKGLEGSYRKASQHSSILDPAAYGASKSTPDLEGFLFPATYELDKGAPARHLVEEQLAAFTEHFTSKQIAAAKALHVTPYQLLTVASMVEREAQVPSDRAKIAAVIYNRLAKGMPLGIDASIYYAVELEKNIPTYTRELTEEQLHIDSPYNTRTHTGLPPTPISNPGVASIEAAAHPSHVGYLYYVAGADGCGEQVFSETQSAFETNVAAYKAAVERNGGHPPACKHK